MSDSQEAALESAVEQRVKADERILALRKTVAAANAEIVALEDAIIEEEKKRLGITGDTTFENLVWESRCGIH